MKNNILFRSVQIVCLLCVLTGCATPVAHQLYPGASLPRSEVASLIVPVEIILLSINGESFTWGDRMGRTKPSVIDLLPGDYTVTARYYMPGDYNDFGTRNDLPDRSAPTKLAFHAEAGKSYVISYKVEEDGITLWVADASSGEQESFPATPVAASAVHVPAGESASEGIAHGLEEMKSIWSGLSEKERKEFQKWTIDNP